MLCYRCPGRVSLHGFNVHPRCPDCDSDKTMPAIAVVDVELLDDDEQAELEGVWICTGCEHTWTPVLHFTGSHRAAPGLRRATPWREPRRNPISLPHHPSPPNPASDGDEASLSEVTEMYRQFHGTDPSTVEERRGDVPQGLVLIGDGVDTGYRSRDGKSNKKGPFVHDFGGGVKVFRPARRDETPDLSFENRPMMVLGANLGFTYRNLDGKAVEVPGKGRWLAAPTPYTLVVVGPKGVEYVMEGGNMHVADWIRN